LRGLPRAEPADILPIRMWGSRQSWLQRALGATAWLLWLCAAGACTGPGLEPPGGDRSETSQDAGDFGSGGSAASGGAGGDDTPPTSNPGDGDGDGDADGNGDAGEASQDASVDDDGGTDPEELEP
jgi:hypothetical protein